MYLYIFKCQLDKLMLNKFTFFLPEFSNSSQYKLNIHQLALYKIRFFFNVFIISYLSFIITSTNSKTMCHFFSDRSHALPKITGDTGEKQQYAPFKQAIHEIWLNKALLNLWCKKPEIRKQRSFNSCEE